MKHPKITEDMVSVSYTECNRATAEHYPTAGGYTSIVYDKEGVAVYGQTIDKNGRITESWLSKELWAKMKS